MEGSPAVSREIEVDDNNLGLDPPPEMIPQEDNISQGNDENVGSPSVYNPQSPQNSPGSESSTNVRTDNLHRASDLLMKVSIGAEPNKNKIIEQAIGAMEELIKMASMGEPLWQRHGNSETLNGLQYLREFAIFDATMEEIIRMVQTSEHPCLPSFDGNHEFPSGSQSMPTSSLKLKFDPLHIEASRAVGFVNMNPINILELLMDSKQWSTTFYNIVSRTTLLGVILHGDDGSYNGMLQVMTAEFHHCTPLVPARQCHFLRFCRKLAPGTWGVVDVSLENLFPYPQLRFRRRPSGCLIQEMPKGSSKVTWVEHVEVDNRSVHPIFGPIVSSGFAFSAKRWIAMINRHCQWLATSTARTTHTDAGVLLSQSGRESLLKLAESMTRKFFMNISSSTENLWMQLPVSIGAEDIRFRFGKTLVFPGKPPSSTIIYTTSVRLPIPTKILFDFLRHDHSRNKWDLLSYNRVVRELAYVNNGENPENRVSIMEVLSSPDKIEILYLQESFYDETGSYVVFAPMDFLAMSMILDGGNANLAVILSSGFVILPDKQPGQEDEGPEGSILTIAFHCADSLWTDEYIPIQTLKTIDGVLTTTAVSIRDAITANGSIRK